MQTNIEELQKKLCSSFCAEIKVSKKNDHIIRIETPFYFPDGDPYQIYLTEIGSGGFRITDMGQTMMQLSYENDIDQIRKGSRGNLLHQIQIELGVLEDDGAFYVESTADEIHLNIFKLGQAITKIHDITFLNRVRVENTFYEDLEGRICTLVPEENIERDYIYSGMEDAFDYPIDYSIQGAGDPLFLFGVPNKDKARLTTIILERLIRHRVSFESLTVFQDFGSIPKNDGRRLMNVAGEMISSLDAEDDFARKIRKRAA